MTNLVETAADVAPPFLEHFPEPGGPAQRIVLDRLPFRIGRSTTAQYVIFSPQVSKEHSEIFRAGKEFRIRDLGSTNGTFVNGVRIKDAPLSNGDIIHLASNELRFGSDNYEVALGTDGTQPASRLVPTSLIRGSTHLREMLLSQNGKTFFQPIVHLKTGKILGFEALGRGTHRELSPNPTELFELAGQCNLAGELSRMFRSVAVGEVRCLPAEAAIFLNLHSSEIGNTHLIESLKEISAALGPGRKIVLEVHEGLVADLATMRWLREELKGLGIGLAYDDFGAGQSRLKELAEVPPDFIKLDMSLIRDIDRAEARQELLQAINHVLEDLGVETIAEGIETEQEARVCYGLGCRYGQGYLICRPQPTEVLNATTQIIHWPQDAG